MEYAIRTGKPAESIINFAHDEEIDLLVISTHGWGGFTRWNISSVAQKVIEKIYLPVLLVRAYEDQETPERAIRYRRIMMPVDSSPRSECAFSAGVRLIRGELHRTEETPKEPVAAPDPATAQDPATVQDPAASQEPAHPTLLLTTVIRPPELPLPEPHGEDVQTLIAQFIEISRSSIREYLDRIRAQFTVPSETRTVEHPSVSEALQRLVKEENIDLIIMAAHGHTGRRHYPYGSVAREMMEFGARPILIIQDIPPIHVQPTDSEIAAQKSEGRP